MRIGIITRRRGMHQVNVGGNLVNVGGNLVNIGRNLVNVSGNQGQCLCALVL